KNLVPFPQPIGLWYFGRWYVPVTVFCVAAMSNSVNLTDGLDGLAAGTTAIAFIAMAIACLPIYPAAMAGVMHKLPSAQLTQGGSLGAAPVTTLHHSPPLATTLAALSFSASLVPSPSIPTSHGGVRSSDGGALHGLRSAQPTQGAPVFMGGTRS
ncbi:unnamed protein product, partial [Closterium sp. NIES-54]